MKSQIAGICAELNEKIDESDKELEALQAVITALETEHTAAKGAVIDQQVTLRRSLHELRITVSTLQDL